MEKGITLRGILHFYIPLNLHFYFTLYKEFLLSEFIIEKMEEENLSVRSLAKKASVSPTVIQKLRNNDSAEKITYSTFLSVIKSLGYRMKLEKI